MKATKSLSAMTGYLGASLAPHDYTNPERPSYPAVSITRQTGARAHSIGETLLSLLQAKKAAKEAPPWTLFENELIQRVLRESNLPETLAKFFPENAKLYLDDIVENIVGLHPPTWIINEKCHELLINLCRVGHVIIIGRCGNFLTRKLPNVLQVRLVGSLDVRTEHLEKRFDMSKREAAAYLRKEDNLRKKYAKENFGNSDINDPLLYDAVINTDELPDEAVAKSIERLLFAKVAKRNQELVSA